MKDEARSTKFEISNKDTKSGTKYDLEDRTLEFAKKVRDFCRRIKKDIANVEDIKQLVRSSGSVGANYIEANDSLSKKDFLMRVKISKKECKVSIYWLKLLDISESNEAERISLIREATEIMKILGAVSRNSGGAS